MKPPEISFVVPLFNHVDYSKAMLKSLIETIPSGLEYELVLVDDGSSDGTRKWLADMQGDNLRVILNATNLGFAKTVNLGVKYARGGVVALLNNDLLLSEGWLEPMLAILKDPAINAGLVGNVQIRASDGIVDHAGFEISAVGKLKHVTILPVSSTGHSRVFAVTGACCLIRREVFERVAGFDTDFLNGGEDIDLCQKVKAIGLHIVMAYHSVVRHHVSLSRITADAQNDRNSRLLYAKWRNELKNELTRAWLGWLQGGSPLPLEYAVDAQFTAAMLATPHALARVVAESVLLQEENFWVRTLDGVDPNSNVAASCEFQGLFPCNVQKASCLGVVAEICVTNVCSARNFFVCGYILGEGAVTLKLTVNGIQEKTITVEPKANFNVGIKSPIILRGITNWFRVSVSAPVMVTHFVLDDHILRCL